MARFPPFALSVAAWAGHYDTVVIHLNFIALAGPTRLLGVLTLLPAADMAGYLLQAAVLAVRTILFLHYEVR